MPRLKEYFVQPFFLFRTYQINSLSLFIQSMNQILLRRFLLDHLNVCFQLFFCLITCLFFNFKIWIFGVLGSYTTRLGTENEAKIVQTTSANDYKFLVLLECVPESFVLKGELFRRIHGHWSYRKNYITFKKTFKGKRYFTHLLE